MNYQAFKQAAVAALLICLTAIPAQSQFTFTTNNGAITITGYTGGGGDAVIPSTINGYPVTDIGMLAFSWATISGVVIPNSVTNIGPYAFAYCKRLVSATIPDSVIVIGDSAFYHCWVVDNVTIGNSVTSIEQGAFFNCYSLGSVIIPDSVTNIGIGAFLNCGLTNVEFGSGVTSIPAQAFAGCISLTSVSIPAWVTDIGTNAFKHCPQLTNALFAGDAPTIDGLVGSFDTTVFAESGNGTVSYRPGTIGWGATFGGWPTAIYGLQLEGAGVGAETSEFGFTISGPGDATVIVEASTNLSDWSSIATNTLNNGAGGFSDPAWTNYPQRFYRVRAQ